MGNSTTAVHIPGTALQANVFLPSTRRRAALHTIHKEGQTHFVAVNKNKSRTFTNTANTKGRTRADQPQGNQMQRHTAEHLKEHYHGLTQLMITYWLSFQQQNWTPVAPQLPSTQQLENQAEQNIRTHTQTNAHKHMIQNHTLQTQHQKNKDEHKTRTTRGTPRDKSKASNIPKA